MVVQRRLFTYPSPHHILLSLLLIILLPVILYLLLSQPTPERVWRPDAPPPKYSITRHKHVSITNQPWILPPPDGDVVNNNPNNPKNNDTATFQKRVLFSRGELPYLVQFAQAFLRPTEEIDQHTHSSVAEVLFVQQGVGEVRVDGDVEQVQVGSAIAIRSGVPHSVKNTGSDYLWILYFGLVDEVVE